MKIKIVSVFLCFVLVFCSGICVAYYNTRTYGFDEDAKVFSYDDKKFSMFDYNIYYDDVNNTIKKAKKFIPDKQFILKQNNI